MWWDLVPIIIVICSILISMYVFKAAKNKRYFWSSLTLSGINLLGGWLNAIYINFITGLILLTIPFLILSYGFYHYKRGD